MSTLLEAAIEACQEMGCYCEGEDGADPDMEDDDREKCVMCKLSDAIRADSQSAKACDGG